MSSRKLGRTLSLCAFALSAPLAAAQNPFQNPSGAPPALTGTSVVAGRVIDAITGKGIAGATINGLVRTRGGILATDDQGRFAASQLPAGAYSVLAMAPGYTSPALGARTAQVRVAEGERVLDVELRLYPMASVSGTVTDEAGLPIVGATVVATRQGLSAVNRGVVARTDDRGDYQLSNLLPGDYILCACLRDDIPFDGVLLTTLASQPANLLALSAKAVMTGSDVAQLDRSLKTFAPTFYPASSAVADAKPIALAPGEARRGVNISAAVVTAARVSGRIVGATAPMNWSALKLIPAADAGAATPITAMSPTVMQPDGRFDFATVPPGRYVLRASVPTTGSNLGPTGTVTRLLGNRSLATPNSTIAGGDGRLVGEMAIIVGDEGLRELTLSVTAGPTIAGRVEMAVTAPSTTRQPTSLTFTQIADDGPAGSLAARVLPSGTFVTPGLLPGKYMLSSLADSTTIAWRGVDITGQLIDVTRDSVTDVVVTVGASRNGTISGHTTGADRMIAAIFPADPAVWNDPLSRPSRFYSAAIKKDGTFITTAAPGDYLVTLIPEIQGDTWLTAERLAAFAATATRVSVAERAVVTIEVKR